MVDFVTAVSAISAVGTILEQTILVLGHFRDAYERSKDAARFFGKQICELKNLKSLIDLLEHDPAFDSTRFNAELTRLAEIEQRLLQWLDKANPKHRGSWKQFSHQLVRGSGERKRVVEICSELGVIKSDLHLHISVIVLSTLNGMTDQLSCQEQLLSGTGKQRKPEAKQPAQPSSTISHPTTMATQPERDNTVTENEIGDEALQIIEIVQSDQGKDGPRVLISKNKLTKKGLQIVSTSKTDVTALSVIFQARFPSSFGGPVRSFTADSGYGSNT